ncbi:tRNA (adenosine(37)-N6)-threonylcarbamoyltransferase complex dimerization subunit type 1 TsaB [Salipiger thiooxidans]|uniref:tRNA (adenosine(37)-N6)-threonylcarbamoyltransferase complex dimerization subunit type 1 TsaB n=1 Tax=Salipiger thiooxidans TaxID=282683 RepID=UPI001CD35175|nr:tRNA (adenosine(37)-N6)-threonylcarbamoyltransferase complex dimerization subunit type 1 TsaB [Salipiger thiooxidans]MCA0850160.1 tRNA (adenosine(37)-N6)-threonylcarbamoyltransferase complex dimerization subunit type 1 TsaB [Salipiger thiooxidans]
MTDTVLAFDTAFSSVSACLLQEGRVVELRHEEMARGQAERLMPMLEEMLQAAGLGWDDLDALGVCTGPGNFTGIRISVAAARGLALALGIPAVGVSATEATVLDAPRPVAAAIFGTRRMSYLQQFTVQGAAPVQPVPEGQEIADLAAGVPVLSYTLPFGAPSCPLVEAVARIAATRFREPALGRPTPLYVRPADAAPSREAPPAILS